MFVSYPEPSEFFSQWYPYLTFAASSWKSGQPPLWTHNLLMGFPLAAFPHAAAFYPPLILLMLFRFTVGFPLFILVHMTARVLFAWALLREWPCSRPASWLAAALFGLSGISLHIVGYFELFVEITWIP